MRNALPVSAGLPGLIAAPAPAQNDTVTTQTPPAPDARRFTSRPGVSPPARPTAATRPGDGVSTTRTTPRVAPATGATETVPTPTL